jgi:hypothetical protein
MSLARKSMLVLAAALMTSVFSAASFAGGTDPVAPMPTHAPIPPAPTPIYFCYPNPFVPNGEICVLLN